MTEFRWLLPRIPVPSCSFLLLTSVGLFYGCWCGGQRLRKFWTYDEISVRKIMGLHPFGLSCEYLKVRKGGRQAAMLEQQAFTHSDPFAREQQPEARLAILWIDVGSSKPVSPFARETRCLCVCLIRSGIRRKEIRLKAYETQGASRLVVEEASPSSQVCAAALRLSRVSWSKRSLKPSSCAHRQPQILSQQSPGKKWLKQVSCE